MGTGINVTTSNWQYTGLNVLIAQASFDLALEWIDDAGAPQSWSGTVTWPNDFSFLSTEQRKKIITELTLKIARVRLGIDGEV